MGGAIFTKGPHPLYVPRMPPQVYAHVLNFCQTQLRQLFIAVTTPIEGPAKTSYGDVDIALAWPRTEFCSSQDAWNVRRRLPESEILEAAARIIGGVRVDKVRDNNGRLGEVHVAVPWPEQFRSLIPPKTDEVSIDHSPAAENPEILESNHHNHATPSPPEAYIQIDLHIHPSLPALQWLLFKHAHGDLWNILGPTIRALGLTADETGLHLRIPEIEKHDIKRARVLLSSDPAQVLAFLGMASGDAPGEPWAEQFATKKEFLEYATSNRFFCGGVMFPPTKYADRDQIAAEGGVGIEKGENKKAVKNDNESRYEENKKKPLRSNERRRIKYRPLFAEFLNDFLPEKRRLAVEALLSQSHLDVSVHADANAGTIITGSTISASENTVADDEKHLQSLLESQFPHTRTSVREECFAYFGPTIRWAYDRTLKTWTIEKQRMAIKRDIIKTIVPPPQAVVNNKENPTSTSTTTTTGDIQTQQAPPPPPPPPTKTKLEEEEEPHDPWNGERLPPSFRGQITSALSKIILDNDFSTLINIRNPESNNNNNNTTSQQQQEQESIIRQELAPPHLSSAAALRDENTGLYNEDNIREYVTHSWRIVAGILKGGQTAGHFSKK